MNLEFFILEFMNVPFTQVSELMNVRGFGIGVNERPFECQFLEFMNVGGFDFRGYNTGVF